MCAFFTSSQEHSYKEKFMTTSRATSALSQWPSSESSQAKHLSSQPLSNSVAKLAPKPKPKAAKVVNLPKLKSYDIYEIKSVSTMFADCYTVEQIVLIPTGNISHPRVYLGYVFSVEEVETGIVKEFLAGTATDNRNLKTLFKEDLKFIAYSRKGKVTIPNGIVTKFKGKARALLS